MKHMNIFFLTTLTIISVVWAHRPATVPSTIVNSFLPRGFNGTVQSMAVDVNKNVFAACFDPADSEDSSAFLLKLDPELHMVWSREYDALPLMSPTIAFSDTMGLYIVIPTLDSTASGIQVWIYEIDVDDGKTIQAVQVDSVNSIAGLGLKAFVSVSEYERPTILLSYVELRKPEEDTVTKIFKFQKMDSSILREQWRTQIHNASRITVSHDIAEQVPGAGIYIAEIIHERTINMSNTAMITMIDKNGSIVFTESFPTMSENAEILCFISDDIGLMYLSESPSYLHHLSMISLNGSFRITKVWSDTSAQITAMHILRNGSLLYALGDSESVPDFNVSRRSEKVPLFVVYDRNGSTILTEKHNQSMKGVRLHLKTFAMKNEAVSSAIVLGGDFQLARTDGSFGRAQISLASYIFPIVASRPEVDPVFSPDPVTPFRNHTDESGKTQNWSRAVIIGITSVISGVIVVVVIFSCMLQRGFSKFSREKHNESSLSISRKLSTFS